MADDPKIIENGDEEAEPIQDEQSEGDDEQGQDAPAEASSDEDPESEEVLDEPAKPSRASSRIQALRNEIKERDERLSRLERQVAENQQRQQQPQQQEREYTPDEMALWTTDQLVQYNIKKTLAPVQQTIQQMQLQNADTGDRAMYAARCATDPRAKRMEAEVEQAYQDAIRQGQFIPREKIFFYKMGERLAQSAPKARETQQRNGQRRIARQQAPSGNARSDQSADRRQLDEKEARNKRLENITF